MRSTRFPRRLRWRAQLLARRLEQMFIMPAYIWWRSTVTHAMAALVLEYKALIIFLLMIRPRSTRPWSLMKPLQPALQRLEALHTTPAYCWWGSMVIRDKAHLNTAINATNVRRLMASMTGPLHSLLHREALEQQRLGQVKGALSGSPTQRIILQDSQAMTRTWLGRTRRRLHSNED